MRVMVLRCIIYCPAIEHAVKINKIQKRTPTAGKRSYKVAVVSKSFSYKKAAGESVQSRLTTSI